MSSTASPVNLVNLPAEIRQQIYHNYFKVEGGYIYDGISDKLKAAHDNNPIELSLIYTCRSIANDTRHLPLSINTIQFSTLYREDWRSLAGCFNLVATYHHVLEADLVLHLARFITPDVRSQLDFEYPDFGPILEYALSKHQSYLVRDDDFEPSSGDGLKETSFDTETADYNSRDKSTSNLCYSVKDFLELYVDDGTEDMDKFYFGFSAVHDQTKTGDLVRGKWAGSFWKTQCALSYCLRLIAENRPKEFARKVFATFPNWTSTDPVQDFLNLEFKHWAIPSQNAIMDSMNLLNLGNVWQLPELWHYTPPLLYDDEGRNHPGYDQRTGLYKHSGVRCREKIRFSAVANAIRFLERLPVDQRKQIRTLILYEDFPSVNSPSAHAQGLSPFFKENPFLHVERRVSLLGCIHGATHLAPYEVAAHFELERENEGNLHKRDFGREIAHWLLDALAVSDSGIPPESFTLVIEAGPHRDYCADLFQQVVQREITWYKAYKELTRSDSLLLGEGPEYDRGSMLKDKEVAALDQLVNQTSVVLSCDFNTGVACDVGALVNETEGLSGRDWVNRWLDDDEPPYESLPPGLQYKDRLADNFEIQTEDDYL
ncbi:hypothetical protein FSARC_7661 [Fusarium sarcochroum]|uniref:Uncharacterized protein n=1 Tax=Fusarium sarcochroum TaxID=1208366 RepID=A0A8H4X820_9HYPO|nr:hypothetical protein FSARC_7661 [Fusarium sarcochroum]